MESTAKIQLSAEEAELIDNTEWILTKHRVIEKVYMMFGELSELMKREFTSGHHSFQGIPALNGKITKGENYLLLPYVILDYPFRFIKDNIFAVRTMFWWGNFFSITLHLSGEHKVKFISDNPDLLLFLKENSFFICVSKDEWEHHFAENNYLPAYEFNDITFRQVIEAPFFKVAKKIPLKQWDSSYNFLTNGFKDIIQFLEINNQN